MNYAISLAARLRNTVLQRFDPIERRRIRNGINGGSIIRIENLAPLFKGSSVFAFATGGSLANINKMDLLKQCNVLMLTTGPVHFFRQFGFMPNVWVIHNAESVAMSSRAICELNLTDSIDFSNTFILVPANSSPSKVNFSSRRFRRLRRLIGPTTYVLYEEAQYDRNVTAEDLRSGRSVPRTYLCEGVEPIATMNGSSVEAMFLPFLSYMGVSRVFFSGVDHIDTGHFWDRNDPWQNEDGTPKSFDDKEVVIAAGEVARRRAAEVGVEVFRLEPKETLLTDYPLIDLDQAVRMSTPRVAATVGRSE